MYLRATGKTSIKVVMPYRLHNHCHCEEGRWSSSPVLVGRIETCPMKQSAVKWLSFTEKVRPLDGRLLRFRSQ